ncbi:MAG: glycosyltransferase family 4 protein [Candidatus Entotheonellia bacterium]
MNLSALYGDRIKVLRVIARLNIGGPAVHVVLLTADMDRARFDSILVSGSENPGEGSMLDYALSHGVQPVILPEIVGEFSLGPRELKALVRLYHVIRRERPHIVHTHTAKAGFIGRLAARLAHVPVIIHTFHGHVLHGYYSSLKTHLLRRMERGLAYLTDCIIAVSEGVKQDLVAYGVAAAEKIQVVPLGLELEPFFNGHEEKGVFRRECHLNGVQRLVGIVGRLFPIKNHRLFLDAAALVAQQEPAAHFVIVGDGVLRSDIERHARSLGLADRVIFTGWRRDLPHIYNDLDVLAVTSNNEGTPVSAIEAMAAGCPVVATKVGGLPDLIREGETGYLVPPGDARAVATALLRVLHQPGMARRMGETGRMAVRERFSAQRLITDMEQLYLGLLERKRALC